MQGRARDIGVPWSEDELKAIYTLKIPVEYVREGILDKETYEKKVFKGEKPLEFLTDPELRQKGEAEGICIDESMTRFDIIRHLEEKKAKEAVKAPVVASKTPVVEESAPSTPKEEEKPTEPSPEDFVDSLDREAIKAALKQAGVEFKGNAKGEVLKGLLIEALKK